MNFYSTLNILWHTLLCKKVIKGFNNKNRNNLRLWKFEWNIVHVSPQPASTFNSCSSLFGNHFFLENLSCYLFSFSAWFPEYKSFDDYLSPLIFLLTYSPQNTLRFLQKSLQYTIFQFFTILHQFFKYFERSTKE